MSNKIILDLETQHDFTKLAGRNAHAKLRVSVCGAYSYAEGKYYCFAENELAKFGEMLESADQIIGYNIKNFDTKVLKPYFGFSLDKIPMMDIMEEIEKAIGHRIGLNAVAQATLGLEKTGTGLGAVSLWKEGKLDELKAYCLNDVKITKEIYEYGLNHGKLMFQDFFDLREIPVRFAEPETRQNVTTQKSLF
jgi:hypothetical protein